MKFLAFFLITSLFSPYFVFAQNGDAPIPTEVTLPTGDLGDPSPTQSTGTFEGEPPLPTEVDINDPALTVDSGSSSGSGGGLIDPNKTIAQNIESLYNQSLGIILTIAFLVVIFAGYTYLTSFGNQEKIGLAKNLLLGAVIGVIFLLMIPLILNLLGANELSTPALPAAATQTTSSGSGTGSLGNVGTVSTGSASNQNAQKIIDIENSTGLSGQCTPTGCERNVRSVMNQTFASEGSGWYATIQSAPTVAQQVPTASELIQLRQFYKEVIYQSGMLRVRIRASTGFYC